MYKASVLNTSDVASTVSSIPLFFELTLFRSFTTIVTPARGLYCSPLPDINYLFQITNAVIREALQLLLTRVLRTYVPLV